MELIDLVWELAAIPDEQRGQKLLSLKAQATQKGDQELLNVISQYESTSESEIQQMMSEGNANTTKSGKGFNWGALASGIGSTVTDVADMIGKIQGNDAKAKADSYINNINTQLSSSMPRATSYDDLAKQWSNSTNITSPDKHGFGYVKPGKAITGALSAGAKGAATGAQIGGPIGAAIGAVAAAGVNVVGTLFGNKNAKEQAELVKQKAQQANNFKTAGFQNNVYNIGNSRMANMQTNWIALGGPLQGAVEYDFIQQSLLNEQQRMNNYTNRITSMPNSFMNEFALGGNRNGGYFSNGLTYVGEGGTHEQNPHEGVLIGYDEQGTPNLVEEGEYIWNDYVFSNRLKVPKEAKNTFGLGGKKDGYTFAEAVDFLQKESEERPLDPISSNGLERQLAKLAAIQEQLRQAQQQTEQDVNKYKFGSWIKKSGKNKTLKDDYYEGLNIEGYQAAPGDYFESFISLIKDASAPEKGKEASDFYLAKQAMLKIPSLAPYIRGTKKLEDITDQEALSLLQNLETKESIEAGIPDIVHYMLQDDQTNIINTFTNNRVREMPIQIATTDKNGKTSVENFQMNGEDVIIKSTPRGYLKAVNTPDPKTGLSYASRAKAMGKDITNLQVKKGEKETVNGVSGSPITRDSYYITPLEGKPKPEAKELKTLHKVKDINGNFIEVDPTELMENPDYADFIESKSITDKDGNIIKYWDQKPEDAKRNPLHTMRYAEPLGKLGMAITDALGVTNTPDYSNADLVGGTADNLTPVSYTPLGQYLTYKPFDTQYAINKLNAQSGATRRALLNNAGLNRGVATAGLLAADYNAQNQIGDLLIKSNEYNDKQRQAIAEFNRQTDKANSEGFMQAAIANQNRDKLMADIIAREAALRQEEKNATDLAKSTNLSGLFDSLGALGKEIAFEDMVNNNKAWYYKTYGEYKDDKKSKGGYLTIKKRRK